MINDAEAHISAQNLVEQCITMKCIVCKSRFFKIRSTLGSNNPWLFLILSRSYYQKTYFWHIPSVPKGFLFHNPLRWALFIQTGASYDQNDHFDLKMLLFFLNLIFLMLFQMKWFWNHQYSVYLNILFLENFSKQGQKFRNDQKDPKSLRIFQNDI